MLEAPFAAPSVPVFELPRPGSVTDPAIGAVPQHEDRPMKNRLMQKNISIKQRNTIIGKIHHHPTIEELHQYHMGIYLLAP